MHVSIWILAVTTALASAAALAQDIPDMRGDWTGKTHTIVAGAGGHWPSSKGTFERPALLEKEIVVEVIGQEDRRFWGTSRLKGESEATSEPFVAEIDSTLRHLVIADTDGYFWGELVDPHRLSYCYANAGGRAGTAAVVSCSELHRKH